MLTIQRWFCPLLEDKTVHQASFILADLTFRSVSEIMPAKRSQGGSRGGDVVADGLEHQYWIRHRIQSGDRLLAPQSKTRVGQSCPRKLPTWIDLATQGDVAMAKNVRGGNSVACLKLPE